jgi:hypothetical protein
MVLARVDLAGVGPGEPAVDHAAFGASVGGLVAEQRDGRRGLQQGLAEAGDDLGRRVLQPVEHAHEAGVDVLQAQLAGRRGVPGQAEQVVALIQGQVQAAGDGGQHRLRRAAAALLLDAAVVISRHAAQCRDLLAAQPAGTPALPPGQPHILRLQRLPAGAEEVSELVAVHAQRAAAGTAGKLTRVSRSASAQIRLAESRSSAAR